LLIFWFEIYSLPNKKTNPGCLEGASPTRNTDWTSEILALSGLLDFPMHEFNVDKEEPTSRTPTV